MSDRDLCERARYDISFKYFLGIAPEDPIVDDSLLSKFRRQRLKDTNILDLLIKKTLDIAIENHIPLGNTIIVDEKVDNNLVKELIEQSYQLTK